MIGELIIIVVLLVLSGVFSLGKGEFLIAGINTLSDEERNKYDVISFLKFIGKILLFIATSVIFSLLSSILEISFLSTIGFILLMLTVIWALIVLSFEDSFIKK